MAKITKNQAAALGALLVLILSALACGTPPQTVPAATEVSVLVVNVLEPTTEVSASADETVIPTGTAKPEPTSPLNLVYVREEGCPDKSVILLNEFCMTRDNGESGLSDRVFVFRNEGEDFDSNRLSLRSTSSDTLSESKERSIRQRTGWVKHGEEISYQVSVFANKAGKVRAEFRLYDEEAGTFLGPTVWIEVTVVNAK